MHSLETAVVSATLLLLITAVLGHYSDRYFAARDSAERQTVAVVEMLRDTAIYKEVQQEENSWPVCDPPRLLRTVQQIKDVLELGADK